MTLPPPPPPPPPPGGEQQYWSAQPQGVLYQPPTTNGLAIAALVGALVLAPVGIVLGHISLAQINRTGEQGRGLAIAGLVIGYIFTALLVLSIVWMFLIANAVTRAFDDYDSASSLYYTSESSSTTYPTYATTTSRTVAPTYSGSDTASVIANASVGDCVVRRLGADKGDGTSETYVSPVSCSSSSATHRVVSRGTSTSSCTADWVRKESPVVVLCLADE
ncbi:DUF4190 domain-containing protein [Rhodococcus erythropolis]|uniref:DUF4190 domain-containing protein n=1 Tax=Rhodococcus erythropolis TaxID=1833 RepID=UPI00038E54E4|nr:DUF4190 domain-containing protein [Rhodococcus erythropolis]EQM31545.1 hypothetical protein N601_22300 [Rhodococcus erythropolis DN1]MDJ0107260.1 DUF4190 domain-containing protein [Rhodococcus erythropolis]